MRGTAPYENLFKDIAIYSKARNTSKKEGGKEGLVILEIGVGRRGCSTKLFLLGLEARDRGGRKGILYSIDIKECKRIQKIMPKEQWKFIHNDSKKVKWDKEIDVLYIDGDHSYEGVKTDYEKYEPFVVEKGLILVHDVLLNEGVRKFWEEIKYPKIILNLNYSGLGIVNKC